MNCRSINHWNLQSEYIRCFSSGRVYAERIQLEASGNIFVCDNSPRRSTTASAIAVIETMAYLEQRGTRFGRTVIQVNCDEIDVNIEEFIEISSRLQPLAKSIIFEISNARLCLVSQTFRQFLRDSQARRIKSILSISHGWEIDLIYPSMSTLMPQFLGIDIEILTEKFSEIQFALKGLRQTTQPIEFVVIVNNIRSSADMLKAKEIGAQLTSGLMATVE